MIVDTSVGVSGSSYYIRAAMCAASIATVPSDYDITALAVLRYVADGATSGTDTPTSTDWSDSVNGEATCYDLTGDVLKPAVALDAPTTVLDSTVLVSVFFKFCVVEVLIGI